jgi:hypothetical protein
MNSVEIAMTRVVSIVIQFGLAIAAWDGWSAFFEHSAFRALAVIFPPGMPAEYVPEPEFLYTGSPERVSRVELRGGSLTWQNERKLRTRKSPRPLS